MAALRQRPCDLRRTTNSDERGRGMEAHLLVAFCLGLGTVHTGNGHPLGRRVHHVLWAK